MKIFPVFIPNAGCPGGCLFCDQRLNSGVVQAPTPSEVAQLLEQSMPPSGLDQIAFYGGSFTALPEKLQNRYLEVVQPYIVSGRVSGVRLSTRPDTLTIECVERLRSYGVDIVELGCQSFSDQVLMASGRNCCAEEHGEAVRLLRDVGLSVGIQLMPGLPGATDDEACDSLRKALCLQPNFMRIYPTVVLSGTGLEEEWRTGRYTPLGLEQAVEICAEMALICHQVNVPIIRFGLQASVDLDAGAVLAGPYHPAFGQMVQSSLWFRALSRLTEKRQAPVVNVHPYDLSVALGQKRCNIKRLHRLSPDLELKSSETVSRGSIRIDNTSVEMMAIAAGNG